MDSFQPVLDQLGLKQITLAERELFERAFLRLAHPISDSSFSTSFCWAEALDLSFAEIEGHLCLFSGADDDLTMMHPPLGLDETSDQRLDTCLEACFALMDSANEKISGGIGRSRIEYVSDEMLDRLRRLSRVELSAAAMTGDYVYPVPAMIELAGGPLKNKRKARSRFLRENLEVETAPIGEADLDECLDLLGRWHTDHDATHEGESNDQLIGTDVLRRRDRLSTERALQNHEAIGLATMLVRSSGRLVGFTLGEMLTPSMAVVYIEKTDPEVDGTPQFIYSEFCRTRFGEAAEVNAGDDWGIPSLRFTKESYRPSRMLSKCVVTRAAVERAGAERTMVRALDAYPVDVVPQVRETPEGYVIRLATPADIDSVQRIEARTFATEGERFTGKQARRLLKNSRGHVLVAQVEGEAGPEVVGWAVALLRTHRKWKSGRIYNVAIDPAWLGRGLGRKLFAAELEWLEDSGIQRTFLEVRADNEPALALYRSAGFETIAPLPDYYGEDLHGVRMRRIKGEPV
ncbi:MAG: ribosomal protein S18 acetylase RimI-like enzyme [Phycisphaerales bacterium]|jgi:ribosomal protein S18 acetylase RimI-like enzyme